MTAPTIYRHHVQDDWVDYNGHMRDAYYALVFSLACDALIDGPLALDAAQRALRGLTLYTLELHLRFLREMKQGAALSVTWRLIAHDHKRLHLVMQLCNAAEQPAAAAEYLLMCINSHTGRSSPWDAALGARLAQLAQTQRAYPLPPHSHSIRLNLV